MVMLQALPLFLLFLQLFDFTKVMNLYLKFRFYDETIFYQVLCFFKAQNKQNKWPQKKKPLVASWNPWNYMFGATCNDGRNNKPDETEHLCILHLAQGLQ
jgi:hypothetical protein